MPVPSAKVARVGRVASAAQIRVRLAALVSSAGLGCALLAVPRPSVASADVAAPIASTQPPVAVADGGVASDADAGRDGGGDLHLDEDAGEDAGPRAVGEALSVAAASTVPPPSPAPSSTPSSAPSSPPSVGTTVVTASRLAAEAPREDHTSSSSVVRPAESPRALDDLGTVLLEVPGVNVTRRGGAGSLAVVSLRGSNPDEVRVYVDGIPLNQAIGGAVDLSTLPLGDVERVEVYRGSSPLAFGQSALGGVISITTQTPGDQRVAVRGGGGSFRTRYADAMAGTTLGRVRLYGGAHVFQAAGDFPYRAPAVVGAYQPGARENNDVTQVDGVLRAAVSLEGRRELRAGFIGLARERGIPGAEMFRSSARGGTARALAYVDYESRGDLGEKGHLRASLYASAERTRFSDPLAQLVGIPTETRDTSLAVGARATAAKQVLSWARAMTLVEGRFEQYLPVNELDPNGLSGHPAHRQVGVAGAEVELRLQPLRLVVIPSARAELTRDARTGRDPATHASLPPAPPTDRLLPVFRIGLLRPVGDGVVLRANAGRYARLPSFLELYGYDRFTLGSPDLRPERGINADLGATVQGGGEWARYSGGLTAFAAVVDDLISWETYSYATRARNISKARIAGLETELRAQLGRLAAIAQATITDARDRGPIAASRDRQLAHRPRLRGYCRLEWRQPIGASGYVISVFADADATAGHHASASAYGELPARLLIGAGMTLEHLPLGLRLGVSAMNLADARVPDFPSYPLPGRAVFAALSFTFPPRSPERTAPPAPSFFRAIP